MNRIDDGHTLSLLACAFTRATGRSRSPLFFCFRIFLCWVVNTGIITVTNKYMVILGISLIILHCLGWCHKMTPGTWHYIVGNAEVFAFPVSAPCVRGISKSKRMSRSWKEAHNNTLRSKALSNGALDWSNRNCWVFFLIGTSRVSVFSRNDDESFQPLFQTEAPFFESVVWEKEGCCNRFVKRWDVMVVFHFPVLFIKENLNAQHVFF